MLRANLVIVIVVMEVIKEVMVEDNSRAVIMVEGIVMVVETVVDTEVEVEVMAVVMVMKKIIQNGWKSLVNLVLISQSTIQFLILDSVVKIKNSLVTMLIKELNVKYKKLLKFKKMF